MRKASIFLALSGTLTAASQTFADERTGTFATDILAVGNSYINAGLSISSEYSDYSRIAPRRIKPGTYESHSSTGVVTLRRGVFESTDVTVSLPYLPVQEYTTAYDGSIPEKVDQRGWGGPSVRIAYGLLGDASKPYSATLALTAVTDLMGSSAGSVTPTLIFGYKLTASSRLYATTDVFYNLKTTGWTQEMLRLGGQYDLTPSLMLDLSIRQTYLNSSKLYDAFQKTTAQLDLIYQIADNFYLSPSFINEWRSGKSNKKGIAVYEATSNIKTYALGIKYLF